MNEKKRLNTDEKDNHDNTKGFVAWVRDHKKQLIIAGLTISTIIAVTLSQKDTIMKLWNGLKKEIEAAKLYSSNWFSNATDAELNSEREKIRLAYCSSGNSLSDAIRLESLLHRFDEEISKRSWGDEIPHAPSIHREHGWYLPNDD